MRRALISALAAGLTYVLVAYATIEFTSDGRNHAAIWLADAVILASLLANDRRNWPLFLVSGLLANHLANDFARGFQISHIAYGLINMGQVVLVALMLGPIERNASLLENFPRLGRFVISAGVVAPALGGLAGGLVTMVLYDQPLSASYASWFTSNSLGLLAATPVFKSVIDGNLKKFIKENASQRFSFILYLSGYLVVVYIAFAQNIFPIRFLPVAAVTLIAFRFGRFGVKFASFFTGCIGMLVGFGELRPALRIGENEFYNIIFYQIYLSVIMLTGLLVAVAVARRAELTARLAEQQELLRVVVAGSPDVLLGFDRSGTCVWTGGPVERLLGLSEEKLIGKTAVQLGKSVGSKLLMLLELGADASNQIVDFEPIGQSSITIEASAAPLDEAVSGIALVITLRDISDRKLRERELRHKALVDDLTHVWNRAGFRAQMQDRLQLPGPHALALLDVDHFKSINDAFGHVVGDEVLAHVAQQLRLTAGPGAIVGRIGGDEFALLLPSDVQQARLKCDAILQDVRSFASQVMPAAKIVVSVSCGLAGFEAGSTRTALIEAADTALYEAKAAGRNRVTLAK